MDVVMLSKTRQKQFDNIIRNAKELFLTASIQDTSMNDIAQKAQIERKTIYNYFSTKKELATAVMMSVRDLDTFYYLGELPNESSMSGYEMMAYVIATWAKECFQFRDALKLEWMYEEAFKTSVLLLKENESEGYIEKTPLGRSFKRGLEDGSIQGGEMDWKSLFSLVVKCLKTAAQKKVVDESSLDEPDFCLQVEEAFNIIVRGLKA